MNDTQYPLKRIVAATDFSTNSELAVLRGARIAQKYGLELHLLHVVHPLDIYPELMLSFDSHLKDYERLKRANGLESLDKLAVRMKNSFEITVKTATRIGRPHIQIAEYVEDEKADLIVVGYRGEQNLLDAIMGSTAVRLLRTASCPVLMIKNSAFTPYKQALVALDLSDTSLKIASMASYIARGARIEMLHVYDQRHNVLSRDVGMSDAEVKDYRDSAIKLIDDKLNSIRNQLAGEHKTSKVVEGYLPESICARINETNADLVVLGKKGKSNVEEFMLGSVSKTVAGMAKCDVLLI